MYGRRKQPDTDLVPPRGNALPSEPGRLCPPPSGIDVGPPKRDVVAGELPWRPPSIHWTRFAALATTASLVLLNFAFGAWASTVGNTKASAWADANRPEAWVAFWLGLGWCFGEAVIRAVMQKARAVVSNWIEGRAS